MFLEQEIAKLVHTSKASRSLSIVSTNLSIHHEPFNQLRAASVIKVPIMMEAFRQHETGTLSLDDTVTLRANQTFGGAGVIHYLSGHQSYTLRQLIELMIIVSDNTAANFILKEVGMDNVNFLLKKLGCTSSKLERYFMDTNAIKKGYENTTSASDLIACLQAIYQPNPLFSESSQQEMLRSLHNQQFKDKLGAFTTSEDILIYHKTGELKGAEHDVALFKKGEHTIYVACLTDGWESNNDGRKWISKLGQLIVDYMGTM